MKFTRRAAKIAVAMLLGTAMWAGFNHAMSSEIERVQTKAREIVHGK